MNILIIVFKACLNNNNITVGLQFVERLRRDPPTRKMKIKLLYDIAHEFSIDWDAKALKLRLYTHPSLYEVSKFSYCD
jgi:vacuolar protein sorting-associated protein IST1